MSDVVDIKILIKKFPQYDLFIFTIHGRPQLWAGHKLLINLPTPEIIKEFRLSWSMQDLYDLLYDEIERGLRRPSSLEELQQLLVYSKDILK